MMIVTERVEQAGDLFSNKPDKNELLFEITLGDSNIKVVSFGDTKLINIYNNDVLRHPRSDSDVLKRILTFYYAGHVYKQEKSLREQELANKNQ